LGAWRSAVRRLRRSRRLSPLASARFGRTAFRRNFAFGADWRGRRYQTKQVEAYAVEEDGDWLVITVLVKYF
jgi:hypothetical protein